VGSNAVGGIDIIVRKKPGGNSSISVLGPHDIRVMNLDGNHENTELMKVIGEVVHALMNAGGPRSSQAQNAIQQFRNTARAVATKGVSGN